jgi:tRNA threonylcarbamoyladenosine biosynthesis protein TsaB
MNILAIDTTTKMLALGVYIDGKTFEYNVELGRKHSAHLLVTIKRVIAELKVELSDFDYFASGIGPGSFTGIRIGFAFIKGLCWALSKPMIAIPSLDILAQNARFFSQDDVKYVFPVIDAKRGLLYTTVYKKYGLKFKKIHAYSLLTVDEFLKKIKPKSLILGDAVNFYKDRIRRSANGDYILDCDYCYPQAVSLLSLALEKAGRGKVEDASKVKPIYLYPKECQIQIRAK